MKMLSIISIGLLSFIASANQPTQQTSHTVLADAFLLKKMAVTPISSQGSLGIAQLSEYQVQALTHLAHQYGKCGGFEDISSETLNSEQIFGQLNQHNLINFNYLQMPFKVLSLNNKPEISQAISELKEENLVQTVNWLSSYPTRYFRAKDPNTHVQAMVNKIKDMIAGVSYPVQVEAVSHRNITQQSVRVRIEGKTRPQEIVVLGGHFDSIVQWGSSSKAPGADDNASGSANVLEVFRVMLQQPQPERTVEFFWYAGEEGGLLGSADIAQRYKSENKNVVAVMQLDMTLFPGEGEFVIGNITDYTSAWARDLMLELNRIYVGARMVDDECGYGCSDHASWYRQGYPTVIPFEATTQTMNRSIHTVDDVVTPRMSFRHSLSFSKLGLAFVMELANSDLRQPY